eukprot:TRINITY_DN26237_c0_g2_i1.p1 TRINITY_DN26237_c0_g2~~TRINITY_DN26237_c0_g2_i1.p1  ORF type:complete len:246 (+),score=22.26 TRINITY_DN26237_c0_g2_i1:95-739(+)
MAIGGFYLVASSMLCMCSARRSVSLGAGMRSSVILEDGNQRVQTSFRSFVRSLPRVASFVQRGVAVHASAPMNATTIDSHPDMEVSDACIEKVTASSQQCQTEAIWLYACPPLFFEEDPELSFPLDEVCLADMEMHDDLKGVKTGCCSDDPYYQGGCCRMTKTGQFVGSLMAMLPFLCFRCCCFCAVTGFLVTLLKLRSGPLAFATGSAPEAEI